jgi:steroid delta-isomerase-like uncharacterized protein
MSDLNANKAVVRRFLLEGAAKNNTKVIDECVAPDLVWHNPFPGMPATRDGVKAAVANWNQGFPGLQLTVVDAVAEGDKVVSRVRFQGTNKGPVMGMPATGKKVDIEFWHVDRIANGKIAERWNIMDNMAFMQQLGAMPAMPAK